jgi:AcrR family transcriptional regulator
MPRILTDADIADFRGRLCNAAAQLFAELGQDGFNMRELAKRVGVSAMTPYRYFQDKDAILAEVRDRAFARLADWLEESLAAADADMATLAHAYAQFAIREQIQYRLMFDLAQPPAAPAFCEQEQRARVLITNHVRRLMERAHLSGDPEVSGLVLWSTLHGAAALYLAGKLSSEDFHRVLSGAACLSADAGASIAAMTPAKLGAGEPWWATPSSFQPAAAAGE